MIWKPLKMTIVKFLPSLYNYVIHLQEVRFIPQPLNLDWSYDCFDQENEEELIFWNIKTQNFLSLRTQLSMLWSPRHMKKKQN